VGLPGRRSARPPRSLAPETVVAGLSPADVSVTVEPAVPSANSVSSLDPVDKAAADRTTRPVASRVTE
jgi:hypothetical protein